MRAIIFDFDGTLADSFDNVLQFLLKKAGRPDTLSQEDRLQLHKLSMKDLALHLGIPGWRLPLVYFQGKTAMTKRMHAMVPFPGMPEVLQALQHEGYEMYIISSNSRRNINHFLVQHGLSGYFKRVYGGAGWFGKAGALRRALKQNHLEAAGTVYVGDEVRDVVGAKLINMPCVAVEWGFSARDILIQHSPMVVVRTPAELQKVLIDWGRVI